MSVYRVKNMRGSSLIVEAGSLAAAVKLFDAEMKKWAREDSHRSPARDYLATAAKLIDTDPVLRRRS